MKEQPNEGAFTPEARKHRMLRAIDRFISASHILEPVDVDAGTEGRIVASLEKMSSEEKATRMYEGMVTHATERRKGEATVSGARAAAPDPYFAKEFQLLWNDQRARTIFLARYGEARVDMSSHRASELGGELKTKEKLIADTEAACMKLQRDLTLGKIQSPTQRKATEHELEFYRSRLEELNKERERMINLEGYEHTPENTDAIAMTMYDTLRRYHAEAEEGFVWVPSRRAIHKRINDVIDHTGKAPLLIGPPGTGKTTQLEAVARERMGASAVRIPCQPGLSEEGLVYIRDIEAGKGAYDYKGTVTEAATGYLNNHADKPVNNHGLLAFLDEISQLSIERALGPIKDIRQAKQGKIFSRFAPYPVLPGFQLAATSNTPIADERLDREFGRIPTDYFLMTEKSPELYEFMLGKLLRDEGNYPAIAKQDLQPAYEKKDIPEASRTKLKDGRVVVAKEELIAERSDTRHGFLYRFAHMLRAVQDSYIHGSQFNEKHLASTALYEDYDQNGQPIIKGYIPDLKSAAVTPGGQMLKLKSGSSTITTEMVSRWMDGFASSGKRDLVKWLQKMFREHIDQADPEDAERIEAIANYFHIFEKNINAVGATPLTPKEIGYLSPRVPRPLYLEQPNPPNDVHLPSSTFETQPILEAREIRTKQVVLEDGVTTVMIADRSAEIRSPDETLEVMIGRRFRVNDEDFAFAGIAEEAGSVHNGKLVGRLVHEDALHKVFEPEQVDRGVFVYDTDSLLKDINNNIKSAMRARWETTCKTDSPNNPTNIAPPTW